MQEFILAAIIKMYYLFLDVVFANLCHSKFFLVSFVSLAIASHTHFHREPEKQLLELGKQHQSCWYCTVELE